METVRLKGISHIFNAIPSHIWLIQGMKNISSEPALALGNASTTAMRSKAQCQVSYGGRVGTAVPKGGKSHPCTPACTLYWLCTLYWDLQDSNSCEFFHFVPLILCLSQCLFQLFQLIWRGITVRGRACNADGRGGAKEKTHLHHEKQALANDEKALCAQVLGTHPQLMSAALCLSQKWPFCWCYRNTPDLEKWPAEPSHLIWD